MDRIQDIRGSKPLLSGRKFMCFGWNKGIWVAADY